MIIVHYEVYILEGRGWMLHARFPRSERETAILEAKELERTLNQKVRVLRESYETEDNSCEEAEIYVTGGKSPDRSKAGGPSGSAPAPGAKSHASRMTAAPARGTSTLAAKAAAQAVYSRKLLLRLIFSTIMGVICAIGALTITPNLIHLIWGLGLTIQITAELYNTIMVMVFGITFLSVAVPLGLKLIPKQSATMPQKTVLTAAENRTQRQQALQKSLDQLAKQAVKEQKQAPLPPEPADAEAEPDLSAVDLPEIGFADMAPDELPEIHSDEEKELQRQQQQDQPPLPPEAMSSLADLQPLIMKFLDGAVATAKTVVPTLDAYHKFALHLYLAGAIDALCQSRMQGDGVRSKLTATALETLGSSADMARKFHGKLAEYRQEPRYAAAMTHGHNAMGDFLRGSESGAHAALRDLYEAWSRKADLKSQTVTVMFTDMVGSTDLTQAKGDSAAQEVVRKHNSIVRTILGHFNGREIKHTGDGIMASFVSAAGAVAASIDIQRQVAQHNARMPDLFLSLRIGLNAGEPIVEENDLFGATVQLSARVCAATNPDQILCTTIVKDLTGDRPDIAFAPLGSKALKGFKDPIALFEVAW